MNKQQKVISEKEYFNEKTMCYEYPNNVLKKTLEQRLNRKLLAHKLRMEIEL